MKRCSTVLVIREVQVKNTMRYYFTFTRMAIIKMSNNTQVLSRIWGSQTLYTSGSNVKLHSHFRKVWQFLKRLNIELSCEPAIPHIYTKEIKTYVYIKMSTQMFTTVLLIIAKKWKQLNWLSTDEWVNNERMWYIHMVGKYFTVTKNEVLILVTYTMGKPWKHHAQWQKPATKDHTLCYSIYMNCPE